MSFGRTQRNSSDYNKFARIGIRISLYIKKTYISTWSVKGIDIWNTKRRLEKERERKKQIILYKKLTGALVLDKIFFIKF